MARDDDSSESLPPRIQAAFRFLYLARLITEQVDSSIPMRALTPLEKSVETSALRAIQQYVLGEMDFGPVSPLDKDVSATRPTETGK